MQFGLSTQWITSVSWDNGLFNRGSAAAVRGLIINCEQEKLCTYKAYSLEEMKKNVMNKAINELKYHGIYI